MKKDLLEMVACQVLHTDLNRRRDFTGSRTRIFDTRSSGGAGHSLRRAFFVIFRFIVAEYMHRKNTTIH